MARWHAFGWHRPSGSGCCWWSAAATRPALCRPDDHGAAAETTTTTAPEPVGGIVAEIGTNRLYAVDHGLGLALRNLGDEPVAVRQVQLTSDQFTTVPITDRAVTLQPGGRRFVVPLPYGEARCDVEPEETFGVVVVVDDGEELHLDATEEYAGAVGRLHAASAPPPTCWSGSTSPSATSGRWTAP